MLDGLRDSETPTPWYVDTIVFFGGIGVMGLWLLLLWALLS